FAGALAAVGAFLLALLIAPWLQPSTPAAVPANAPGRIAIARRGRPPAASRRFVLLARPDEDDAALSRLPGALQERIRQRLWGEDRERAREALERAELGVSAEREGASPTADRLAQASHPIDASDPEERWAIAPKPPSGAKPSAGEQSTPAAGEAPGGDQEAARGDGAREAERDGGAGPRQAAAGAGTGTDPNLLGEASAERAARERFELPLAARVHALGGGPAPPSAGEAPPPAPDARPDLAAAQRRDAPVLKMSVPPAYEAVVRAAFAHILLADEINRATPKTQSALLEAMAEQQVTVAGTSHPLAPPFFVLATLNPIEMEGTYQLPEAQLDRFLFKVLLDYPSAAEL